jgi:hypothetical protein
MSADSTYLLSTCHFQDSSISAALALGQLPCGGQSALHLVLTVRGSDLVVLAQQSESPFRRISPLVRAALSHTHALMSPHHTLLHPLTTFEKTILSYPAATAMYKALVSSNKHLGTVTLMCAFMVLLLIASLLTLLQQRKSVRTMRGIAFFLLSTCLLPTRSSQGPPNRLFPAFHPLTTHASFPGAT